MKTGGGYHSYYRYKYTASLTYTTQGIFENLGGCSSEGYLAKLLKEWNFSRDWGLNQEQNPVGAVWIFHTTIQNITN